MKNKIIPYILLTPMLVIMIGLVFYPIFITFSYSLQSFKLTKLNDTAFIGLDNYKSIFSSPEFHNALQNTLIILVIVLVMVVVFSFIGAFTLNISSRFTTILTTISILPWALPPIVNGLIWKWIFFPGYGLVNKVLINFNIITEPIQWTTNKTAFLFIVSITVAWRVLPFCIIVLLSALQSIPKDVIEAAAIDGANRFKIFLHILLPLLLPALAIVVINTIIQVTNVFDEVVSLIGYKMSHQTLLIYNYMNTFSFLNFGYGSAITYVIMLLSGLIGILYVKSMSRTFQKDMHN